MSRVRRDNSCTNAIDKGDGFESNAIYLVHREYRTILAISNFIECPSTPPPPSSPAPGGNSYVDERQGVTRVRSFTPRGLRNTRGRNGENKFPRTTRLCLRSNCDRHHHRHRFNDDHNVVTISFFRCQQKRMEKTIKTQQGRAR